MAAGDVKKVFVSTSTLTVTNLHSLPASSTFIGGWESDRINHSSDLPLDDSIGIRLATHASNRQAGTFRIYLVPSLNNTPTWPDVIDGTESTETWTDTEERDSIAVLVKEIAVDNTASAVYDIFIGSVKAFFDGNMLRDYVIFITGDAATSTNAQLAASGSAVYVNSSYLNVAQS